MPLIVQRELLGYVYADIDGAFGRFHDGDRDLLAMLASQAAVALANVRFAAGWNARSRSAPLSLRASARGELAIINSIQQGIAGSLDFQGIVDLVGDKLREVFKSDDIGISLDRPRGAHGPASCYVVRARRPHGPSRRNRSIPPSDGTAICALRDSRSSNTRGGG